jgi:hypothetical protein
VPRIPAPVAIDRPIDMSAWSLPQPMHLPNMRSSATNAKTSFVGETPTHSLEVAQNDQPEHTCLLHSEDGLYWF